jgi:hypothetical protein
MMVTAAGSAVVRASQRLGACKRTDMLRKEVLALGPVERGTRTFQTIEDYPFAERIRSRTPQAAVVELAVSGGVRDISSHVIDVYRRVA